MLSRDYRFTVILQPERDPEFARYYNATLPALPGCVSYGVTRDEALRNIREAMEGYLEDMKAAGEELPQDAFEQMEEPL